MHSTSEVIRDPVGFIIAFQIGRCGFLVGKTEIVYPLGQEYMLEAFVQVDAATAVVLKGFSG